MCRPRRRASRRAVGQRSKGQRAVGHPAITCCPRPSTSAPDSTPRPEPAAPSASARSPRRSVRVRSSRPSGRRRTYTRYIFQHHRAQDRGVDRGCVRTGSGASGAPQSVADALYRYGMNLGTAFQIQDDLLDLVGEERLVGKPLGRDLELGSSRSRSSTSRPAAEAQAVLAQVRSGRN